RRDWEQTKADLGKGKELHQNVSDTVKQAVGKEAIPPANLPNPPDAKDMGKRDEWGQIEPAVRYGYGARSYYADVHSWDDQLEGKLREEWRAMNTGRSWDDSRAYVR